MHVFMTLNDDEATKMIHRSMNQLKKQPFLSFSDNQGIKNKFKRFITFNDGTLHVFISTNALPKVSIFGTKL